MVLELKGAKSVLEDRYLSNTGHRIRDAPGAREGA
jgi:hypothetical protein